jgi:hypothetical protein
MFFEKEERGKPAFAFKNVIRDYLAKVAANFSGCRAKELSALLITPVYVQRSCTVHAYFRIMQSH